MTKSKDPKTVQDILCLDDDAFGRLDIDELCRAMNSSEEAKALVLRHMRGWELRRAAGK